MLVVNASRLENLMDEKYMGFVNLTGSSLE
jgi:hypothetical protein